MDAKVLSSFFLAGRFVIDGATKEMKMLVIFSRYFHHSGEIMNMIKNTTSEVKFYIHTGSRCQNNEIFRWSSNFSL
jgi:hypothetical protein